MAYEILEGFGDAILGEWTEDRPRAFHVRRRLNPQEQERIGDAIDLRGTGEGFARLQDVLPMLPEVAVSMAKEELGLG